MSGRLSVRAPATVRGCPAVQPVLERGHRRREAVRRPRRPSRGRVVRHLAVRELEDAVLPAVVVVGQVLPTVAERESGAVVGIRLAAGLEHDEEEVPVGRRQRVRAGAAVQPHVRLRRVDVAVVQPAVVETGSEAVGATIDRREGAAGHRRRLRLRRGQQAQGSRRTGEPEGSPGERTAGHGRSIPSRPHGGNWSFG